jgi:hypothetical protein
MSHAPTIAWRCYHVPHAPATLKANARALHSPLHSLGRSLALARAEHVPRSPSSLTSHRVHHRPRLFHLSDRRISARQETTRAAGRRSRCRRRRLLQWPCHHRPPRTELSRPACACRHVGAPPLVPRHRNRLVSEPPVFKFL